MKYRHYEVVIAKDKWLVVGIVESTDRMQLIAECDDSLNAHDICIALNREFT